MSNTDNQSVKAEIINNVIVAMTYYLSSDVLEMLERVLTKKLAEGTKYGYVSAIKRLVTLVYKPLTEMEEPDIYYYLDWYEHKNVSQTGRKNQPKTINNERRFISAFLPGCVKRN